MKISNTYRFYLVISLISLFISGFLSLFQQNDSPETFALIAFIFFAIAVFFAALEELLSSRPNMVKKIKPFFRIWKK